MKKKELWKKVLSLVLCFCMTFGMGFTPNAVSYAKESTKKMLHYMHLNNNRGILGQDVKLEKGVSYTFSYAYKMVTGEHNVDTGMFVKVLDKGLNGSLGSVNTGYTYSSEKKAGETKGFTTVDVDGDSKAGKATYTFTWTKESGTGSVFFHVPTNKGAEFYLAGVTLYKSADAARTNLLKSIDETGNLNGWLHTNAWPVKDSATWTCNDGSDRYKVSVEDYDGTLFGESTMPQKMLYVDVTNDGVSKVFGQNVKLTKGSTYTISFQYKFVDGSMNTEAYFRVKDKFGGGSYKTYYCSNETGEKAFTVQQDNELGRVSYTFTHTGNTKEYGIGFEFLKPTKLYLADLQMYDISDETKANLFPAAKNESSLVGWRSDWRVAPADTADFDFLEGGKKLYNAKVMDYDANVFKGSSEPDKPTPPMEIHKMIHYTHLNNNRGIFGQNVTFEQGATYTLSYSYSMVKGEHNVDTGMFVKVLDKGLNGSIALVNTGYTFGSEKTAGEDKGFATAKIEGDSQRGRATYTFTWAKGSGTGSVYFHVVTNNSAEFYLADIKLYKNDDAEKSNLLQSVDRNENLNGWLHTAAVPESDATEWVCVDEKQERYKVAVEDYRAALFEEQGGGEEPGTPGSKMLRYQYLKNNGGIFGQNVAFEKNQEYTISFEYNMVAGDYNTDLLLKISETKFDNPTSVTGNVRYMSSEVTGGVKGFASKEEKGDAGKGRVTYTFKWEQESGDGSVWFHTPGGTTKEIEFYLANIVLYRTDDAKKTNLMASIDTNGTLKGWGHPWQKATDNATEWTAKVFNQPVYTVTVLDYNKTLFELSDWVEPAKPTGKQMIYVEVTAAGKDQFFGQNMKLEKGKTYTIAYQYKFLEGEMDESAYLRVKAELGSGVYKTYYGSSETGEKGFNLKTDKKTCTAFYTFTHQQETGVYGVGFQFTAPTKLYLADVTMYDTNDADKTNLLPACNDEHSLEGWRGDWTAAGRGTEFVLKGKQGEVQYTAALRNYDAAVFQPDPELPPKMVYIENNGTYRQLIQRVKLEVGETYRFSFCVASPVALKGMVMHKGERVTIFNNMSPINDPDYTKDYYEVEFEFTLPSQHGGENVDLGNVFVGIQFPAGANGYVFRPKLWNVNDPEKENIYKNPGFNKGLDNWAFSWGAWFIAGLQGMGLNEYEAEGKFKLQVMDYDEQKFITYYDDSRIDDGEWWSADDVKAHEKKTSALVKGRYMHKDKKPIRDAELELKSLKESFTCKTDDEGRFEFADVPEGYYKLYVVQKTEGQTEQIETGFAASIKDGYKVNIDVYSDGTVINALEPWVIALIGGGAAVLIAAVTVGSISIVRRRKKKPMQTEQEK